MAADHLPGQISAAGWTATPQRARTPQVAKVASKHPSRRTLMCRFTFDLKCLEAKEAFRTKLAAVSA